MKKKFLFAAFVSLCAIGLASCGGETSSVDSSTPDSTVSESTPDTSSEASSSPSSSADTYSLSISYSGTAEAGQSITLIATMYINGTQRAIADQENVTYTAADDASAALVEISGFTVNLLGSGDCTLNASYTYDGTLISTEYTFTIAEGNVDDTAYTTIADLKAIADASGTGTTSSELYRIRGQVMNTSGSSAYIADETGGMYIYNWYFSSTDTACSSYNWQVGTNVDVKGVIQNYYGVAELKNYITGSGQIDGTYANLYNGTINPIAATELTTEGDLQALAALDGNYSGQIGLDGNPYNITCQYVSGEVDTSTTSYIVFKIGETELELRTDGSYDDWGSDLKSSFDALQLNEGDTVKISNIPLYEVYKSVQFHYFSQGTTIEVIDRVEVNSVSVTLDSSTIAVTGSTQATAAVDPETIRQDVTWTSSDTSVATVDENGVVTGVATGSATITATSDVDSTVSGSAGVSVVDANDASVAPSSISVSANSSKINIDGTTQATAEITPAYAAQTVTWSSSDSTIASVDENGLITGVALGEATITATSTVNNSITGSVNITVTDAALEVTYTYDFSVLTGTGTLFTDDTALEAFTSSYTGEETSILTGVSGVDKLYNGYSKSSNDSAAFEGSGLIKAGTSSVNGTITLAFSSAITKVVINCHSYNTSTAQTISVTNADSQTASTSGTATDLEFELSEASSEITITTEKRAFIWRIDFIA